MNHSSLPTQPVPISDQEPVIGVSPTSVPEVDEKAVASIGEPDWKTNSDAAFLAAVKASFEKNKELLRRLT